MRLCWNYRSCEIFKKLDFDCYLMAKANSTISMGMQKISAERLLCFTMLLMTDVTREPRAQQGKMLAENKIRGCCQERDSSRWKNLLCTTVSDRPGPSYKCWAPILPQEKSSPVHTMSFQIQRTRRRMGDLNATLQKSNRSEFLSGAALLEPIEFC